jgi:hypothetical protein
MALFDVIKYPISIPPTAEEFAVLPYKLYKIWIEHPDNSWSITHDDTRFDRLWVSKWMNINNSEMEEEIKKDIALLRKIIKEYEE